jgi:ubiquinone/menaquinone biosynthesis C-methylase UbiE
MSDKDSRLDEVAAYYGDVLEGRHSLRTGACCSQDALSPERRRWLDLIVPDVRDRFYGCGSPLPFALEGCHVLDLGCGSGRDVYLASALVGPQGRVTGVDMSAGQLAVARRHRQFQAWRFGHAESNVNFCLGRIEALAELGIGDNTQDVVISNCVINLSPDKERVFAEIRRVLKPGGELLFSDVFADRRVPAELARDPVLRNECLAGAMYVEDFRRTMLRAGWGDCRELSRCRTTIGDAALEAQVGDIVFHSLTLRAFKLSGLEDRCENYGQTVTYLGTLPECPDRFALDAGHVFVTGVEVAVCGNTAAMLGQTRYARHFRVDGDRSRHYGLFDCAPAGGGCC